MNTPEGVTARKMSIYWMSLLLLNGIDVYPLQDNKGSIVKRIAATYPWIMGSIWVTITLPEIMLLMAEHSRNSYEQTIETLAYATGSGSTLILLIIGVYKRPAMYKMLTIMRNEFQYDGHRRLAADQLFSRFMRSYGAVFPVANLITCLAPLVWMFRNKDYNSQKGLIYQSWMPWEPSSTKYAVLYVVQFILGFSALANIAGMVMSMVLFVNELQVQMDILVDTMRELDVDYWYESGKLDSERTQRSYDGIVKCVKHHQTLIKYFNHFKSYFNLLFGFELLYILIMTCLCASSILFSKDVHISLMSLLTIVVSQYFFYCLIGEQCSGMNKKLGDCVYFKLLKCKCSKLKKIGILIVLRCQEPLQLNAMGISKYTASLFTFTVTMKSAYAGLNVLYNSSK